jgi:predicted membrane GTPase involved in stress response
MYYDYPIEQLARSARTSFQIGFARAALYLMPEMEDILLDATPEGLKILGRHESALAKPGEIISQIYREEVELKEPRVRFFHYGAVHEPVMWVRLSLDYRYSEDAVLDLVRRDAEMEEVDWLRGQPVIRARASLRRLLGYPQALATLSNNTADLRMWLSHYAPVPPEPGGKAA